MPDTSDALVCANLCLDMLDAKSDAVTPDQVARLVCSAIGDAVPAQIYIGSYFCDQLFLSLDEVHLAAIERYCEMAGPAMVGEQPDVEAVGVESADRAQVERPVRITLVVPVMGQRLLAQGKAYLAALLDEHPLITEVVVNDIGMLHFVKQRADGRAVMLGRLFMKDLRDPRYPSFQAMCGKPDLPLNASTMKRADGIELDPYRSQIDATLLMERMNAGFELALHEPYCYLSTGRVCEAASRGARDASGAHMRAEFVPGQRCALQCQESFGWSACSTLEDAGQAAAAVASGALDSSDGAQAPAVVDFIQKGRAVFYRSGSSEVVGGCVTRIVKAADLPFDQSENGGMTW